MQFTKLFPNESGCMRRRSVEVTFCTCNGSEMSLVHRGFSCGLVTTDSGEQSTPRDRIMVNLVNLEGDRCSCVRNWDATSAKRSP